MKIGLEAIGGPELIANIRALSASVRRKTLYPILREAAEPLRARMAELAPRGDLLSGPEGHLKDHIGQSPAQRMPDALGDSARLDEFQAAIAVGPTRGFFYGHFLEYGTVRMSAESFMRPPFDSQIPDMLKIIREGLWDVLRETVKVREAPASVIAGPGGGDML